MNSVIVFIAQYFFLISIALVGIYWLRVRTSVKIPLTVQLIVGGLLALALARITGHFYYDPRPFVTYHIKPLFPHAADNGFPSDHALLTSFLAFTMYFYSKRLSAALLVNALVVSWARVAAHVHSPRDIVGSFVFSAIAVTVVHFATKWWQSRGTATSWRQRS